MIRSLQDDAETEGDTEVESASEEESESADQLRSLEVPKARDCKISKFNIHGPSVLRRDGNWTR